MRDANFMKGRICKIVILFIQKILVLLIYATFSIHADAEQNDFYKAVALDAISANINYYESYYKCLKKNISNNLCTHSGEIPSDGYINNVGKVKVGFLEKANLLYSSNNFQKQSDEDIVPARNKFFHESIYLQRKLLIFIANTEKRCGEPEAYQALIDWSKVLMEHYETNPINIDEEYFIKYDNLISNYLESNKSQCKYYLKFNSRLFYEVYADQVSGIKKNMKKEELLALFVYTVLNDLISQKNETP